MSTLHPAIYTEVEPATLEHGTQVVARMGTMRVACPYPHELSDWADVHAVAVQGLLERRGNRQPSRWTPALFGAGVIWVCDVEPSRFFEG